MHRNDSRVQMCPREPRSWDPMSLETGHGDSLLDGRFPGARQQGMVKKETRRGR